MTAESPAMPMQAVPRTSAVWHRLGRNAWGLVLLVLLAPLLVWLAPLLLLFLLWPALVALNPLQALPAGMTRMGVWRDVLRLLLFCIPLLGLLRAASLLPWMAWPEIIGFTNRILLPGVIQFGPAFVPWFDLCLGLLGFVVALGFALQDLAWRVLGQRRVARLPRTRVADLQPGLVQLQGRARSLYDEHSDILYYLPAVGPGSEARAQHNSFYLEDDSGRVMVDTSGACFSDLQAERGEHGGVSDYLRGVAGILDTRCSEIVLPGNERVASDGRFEWSLRSGDPVYLVGVAQLRFHGDAEERELVIRPRGQLFGNHFHQVFFLTNGKPRLPKNYFRHGLAYSGVYAAVSLFFCAWLAALGWAGQRDFATAYGYEPLPESSAPFQQEVIPLPERRGQVPGYGLISVSEMLQKTRTASAGSLIHLLGALEGLNAQELLTPVLRDIVLEDADEARRHIAENKLRLWGEPVPRPPWHFAALYLDGARVPIDNQAAEDLLNLATHAVSSCRSGNGGKAAFAQRERLIGADRIFVRFAMPQQLQQGEQQFAVSNAGFTLATAARPSEVFAYTERSFRLLSGCGEGVIEALWCHRELAASLGARRPPFCRR